MSDKIRDDLKKTGITLEDTPKRILWKLTESKEQMDIFISLLLLLIPYSQENKESQ